jgi:hypothetical protein
MMSPGVPLGVKSLDGASAFATEDWNHIGPRGVRTRGREAVLKSVVEVHITFLEASHLR